MAVSITAKQAVVPALVLAASFLNQSVKASSNLTTSHLAEHSNTKLQLTAAEEVRNNNGLRRLISTDVWSVRPN